MSFFNYPVYDILDADQKDVISLTDGVNIIVKKEDYIDSSQTLLGKILKSVGQELGSSTIHSIEGEKELVLSPNQGSVKSLVLVFGLAPNECSLQLDTKPYVLFRLSGKTLLFSKSLTDLPGDAQGRRALWTALKDYYKI